MALTRLCRYITELMPRLAYDKNQQNDIPTKPRLTDQSGNGVSLTSLGCVQAVLMSLELLLRVQ